MEPFRRFNLQLGVVAGFFLVWLVVWILMRPSRSSFDVVSKAEPEITQIWLSPFFSDSFSRIILTNTNLQPYSDPNKPAFFYGLMVDAGFKALVDHKAQAVVIFTGGDANIDRNGYIVKRLFDYILANQERVRAVAISTFIARTLQKYGLRYVERPFFPLDFQKFAPAKKGKGVFVYGLPDNVYHNDIVRKEVQPKFPQLSFFFTAHMGPGLNDNLPPPYKHYSREQLIQQVYPQCFIGLRLTHHDGLAGGVQELGDCFLFFVFCSNGYTQA